MDCSPPALVAMSPLRRIALLFSTLLVICCQFTESLKPFGSFPNGGCRFPGAPAHSIVTFSNESLPIGSVATYKCERGFELLGPQRRVCSSDGHWTPEGIPFCVLNVAAGKAPMQISSELGGIPQKAIDGSTSAYFNSDTCTLTKHERVPWWYVNLLEPYMVQLVRLDFGKACCGGDHGATIIVRVGNNRPDLGTNPICNKYTGFLEEGKPLFLPCNPPMPGAFVSVHLEGHGPSQLSICEAFVYTDQALPIERCPQFRDQPPGSTATYNGKCYIFYNRQPLAFREALGFCHQRGGTLVDESNPALQGFISWELWRRHRSDTNSQYWMGAVRDTNDRHNWKWINGEDVTISFWNLPGGDQDCARYDGAKGWLWSDTNCHTPLNFICQHQPKACGKPEQPPNSTMIAKNFNVGAVINYRCDEGHLLVGPHQRTCLPTGFYNEFPPVCKRIECGFPADIVNGQYQLINGSVAYRARVVYSCDEGFEMSGRANLMCDIDERWNGPPPRCDPIECEDPPNVENAEYSTTNNVSTVGTIVEYFCRNRTHRLVGSKRLICLPTGDYDNPPPVCRKDTPPIVLPTTPPASVRPAPIVTSRPTFRPKPTLPRVSPPAVAVTRTTTQQSVGTQSLPTSIHQDNAPEASHEQDTAIYAHHPQDNEIPGSNNARADQAQNVDLVSLESDRRDTTQGARLNLGAIIALGVFGGFVFLAAVITTIVILIRRSRSAKHYRHRASPDCNTVASFDSSSSESRAGGGGLNRYYRKAWENLHESNHPKHHSTNVAGAGGGGGGGGARSGRGHKETLDTAPGPGDLGYRNSSSTGHLRLEGMRDGSELVVSDVFAPPASKSVAERKRHHHHHHHHAGNPGNGGPTEWRHQHPSRHQHKRY